MIQKMPVWQFIINSDAILDQLVEENGNVRKTVLSRICNVHVKKLPETVSPPPELGSVLMDLISKWWHCLLLFELFMMVIPEKDFAFY